MYFNSLCSNLLSMAFITLLMSACIQESNSFADVETSSDAECEEMDCCESNRTEDEECSYEGDPMMMCETDTSCQSGPMPAVCPDLECPAGSNFSIEPCTENEMNCEIINDGCSEIYCRVPEDITDLLPAVCPDLECPAGSNFSIEPCTENEMNCEIINDGCSEIYCRTACEQTIEGHATCAELIEFLGFCGNDGVCISASGCEASDCCVPGASGDAWCGEGRFCAIVENDGVCMNE